MIYKDIITLLCPGQRPEEEGYLWARFPVEAVPGCRSAYYCANDAIAAELLTNQIRPTLRPGTGYFVVFPVSDTVEIAGTRTVLGVNFMVVHYGWYDGYQSESIARTHVTQFLARCRADQQAMIAGVRINNSNFSEWAADGSVVQQYTAAVTVKAVESYALAPDCHDTDR